MAGTQAATLAGRDDRSYEAGAALVGRAAELGRLTGLLDQAAAGQPVVAVISGDAGVGKTRLVAELSRLALDQDFTVLSGRCAELGDTIPYLPLADALRNPSASPAAQAALADAVTARPVLGGLLPDRGGTGADTGEGPELARQQLFGAVLGMLDELAGQAPVLLVLEDLHWADQSTRHLITFLSRVLHRERVAMIVTYRTDDLYRGHPLQQVAAELLRLPSVTALQLGPLNERAMAEHLTACATAPLTAAALDRIIRRAEGNAYYAEELLAASADGKELPAGLADLLLARIQRVSAPAQQVVRAAAVAGRQVDDDLVQATASLGPAEYEQAIREAVASQLLIADGGRGYSFRHALLREAIYADLLPGERARLHARLAGLLADEARLSVPGTAASLAYHCLASHDIPGALAASARAGKEAQRLAAPAEAHRHFDQVLALWERVDAPEELAGMSRGWIAYGSAVNAARSGEVARGVQQLRSLVGYLGPDADPVLRSRANEELAYLLLDVGDPAAAAHAARAAIDAVPERPPSWERARAIASYALAMLYSADLDAARQWAELARAAAKAADSPLLEADALITLGQLAEWDGKPDRASELFTLAYDQTRDGGLHVYLRAAFHKARVHLESGDLADASATAHAGLRRAADAGLSLAPHGLELQFLHYLAHYSDGAWDHAQELADGFPVRVSTTREAVLSAMALFVEVGRGSPGVAERRAWLEPLWADPDFSDYDEFSEYIGRGQLAEAALWRGDTDEALTESAASIAVLLEHGGYAPPLIRVAAIGLAAQADRASQARAAGDDAALAAAVDAADGLIETARRGAAYPARPNWVLGVDGRAWLARAEAEWRRARGQADPEAWRAVVQAFGPAFVYEAARSRWRLAEALVEAGQRAEAQREWEQAVAVADRLGARPLRTALGDLGRRARFETDGTAGEASGRSPIRGLTAREHEVLGLLAAGRSNREIATELFITPKTASVHVSNILAKLRASSRTEAAAIAHAEGIGLPAGRSG